MQRTIHTPLGALQYELIQTQRKNLELRMQAGGQLRLFAPRRTPLRTADAFVGGQCDWIERTRAHLDACAKRRSQAHPMSDGAVLMYEGRPLTLRIERAPRSAVAILDGCLWVRAQDMGEEALRGQLERFFIERARERVSARVEHYAPQIGRRPERIAIRSQRTRWGSCSAKHNLNFNWKLIQAPPEALDYVVIHELCHLYEFNHSERFWARVAAHQGDYLVWRQWLKQNGGLLGI